MKKRQKHSFGVWLRKISGDILPKCNRKIDFFLTFIMLMLALLLISMIAYAIITFAAITLMFMVERIWPVALVILLATLVIFCNRYGDEIFPEEVKTEAK